MKIKVVTIKDIFKYLAKISIIFGVIAIFANFFYNRKNVNNYFTFDSRKFVATLKNEIVLLKQDEAVGIEMNKRGYITGTIDDEFSMFKAVATIGLNESIMGDNQGIIKNEQDAVNDDEQLTGEDIENSGSLVSWQDSELEEAQTGLNVEVLPSNIKK